MLATETRGHNISSSHCSLENSTHPSRRREKQIPGNQVFTSMVMGAGGGRQGGKWSFMAELCHPLRDQKKDCKMGQEVAELRENDTHQGSRRLEVRNRSGAL